MHKCSWWSKCISFHFWFEPNIIFGFAMGSTNWSHIDNAVTAPLTVSSDGQNATQGSSSPDLALLPNNKTLSTNEQTCVTVSICNTKVMLGNNEWARRVITPCRTKGIQWHFCHCLISHLYDKYSWNFTSDTRKAEEVSWELLGIKDSWSGLSLQMGISTSCFQNEANEGGKLTANGLLMYCNN